MNASFVTDWNFIPAVVGMGAFGAGPFFDGEPRDQHLSKDDQQGQSLWPPRLALLAGGLATRLRPLTSFMPKSLIHIAGEPFLAHQLRLIRAGGIREVVLCCGFLGEQIEDFAGDGSRFGLSITYSHDGPQPLGTGGALLKALPHARFALPHHVWRQLAHRAHRAHLAFLPRLAQARAHERLLQSESLGRQ
jgi:hypothetical protein